MEAKVSEGTSLLSRSLRRKKFRRKADNKKKVAKIFKGEFISNPCEIKLVEKIQMKKTFLLHFYQKSKTQETI